MKRAGENKPRRLIAQREVHTFRIKARGPPAPLGRSAELFGIKSQRLGMVFIHMGKRACLSPGQCHGPRDIEQELGAQIARRLGKTAIEVGLVDLEPPEGEITKIRIEGGFGVAGEETGAGG